MFSGEAGKRAKAYSPLTARELSSGEASHAEEPKAEEELKASYPVTRGVTPTSSFFPSSFASGFRGNL